MRALVALALLIGSPALAHDFAFTEVLIAIDRDGSFQADMTIDVDALALGVSPEVPSEELYERLSSMPSSELDAAIDRAKNTLLRRVRFRFDGERAEPALEFPDIGAPFDDEPTRLGLTARFKGTVPITAGELVFFASRALGPTYVTITDARTGAGRQFPLQPGEESPPFDLTAPSVDSVGGTLWRYGVLGFKHIIPLGIDHILFVLGLFLASKRWRPLLIQVTAFTVAHTATLALSMNGIVSLPSGIVEPLIALSIAWIAVENLIWKEMRPWRPIVVFGFGLLHGLGFAGVLGELGLPEGRFVPALVGFNVGVEIGQLAVIAGALLAVGWARRYDGYRRWVVLPASIAIGAIGLYWSVERALG